MAYQETPHDVAEQAVNEVQSCLREMFHRLTEIDTDALPLDDLRNWARAVVRGVRVQERLAEILGRYADHADTTEEALAACAEMQKLLVDERPA